MCVTGRSWPRRPCIWISILVWALVDSRLLSDTNLDSSWRFHRPIPSQSTIRNLLQEYLDINAIPRRSFFETIQPFAVDEAERKKLNEFGTIEGQVILRLK